MRPIRHLLTAGIASLTFAGVSASAEQRHNVIFMVADDLGYGEFQDKNGKWWTAMWMWDKGFSHQFWITGIDFTADGTIYPTGGVIQK